MVAGLTRNRLRRHLDSRSAMSQQMRSRTTSDRKSLSNRAVRSDGTNSHRLRVSQPHWNGVAFRSVVISAGILWTTTTDMRERVAKIMSNDRMWIQHAGHPGRWIERSRAENLRTLEEIEDAKVCVARAPGNWSGPWSTEYPWESEAK